MFKFLYARKVLQFMSLYKSPMGQTEGTDNKVKLSAQSRSWMTRTADTMQWLHL